MARRPTRVTDRGAGVLPGSTEALEDIHMPQQEGPKKRSSTVEGKHALLLILLGWVV